MKIKSLKISNILSFKYFENIEEATSIEFDNNLNILIGENGAGKSTVLEILNFIFKRILFKQYIINQDLIVQKATITPGDKKNILTTNNEHKHNQNQYQGFRLDPNWGFENSEQRIRIEIQLDDIDKANMQNILSNKEQLSRFASIYSSQSVAQNTSSNFEFKIDIELTKAQRTFKASITPDNASGFEYLANYNYYKHLIDLYNLENPSSLVPGLFETISILGGYRNYYAFNPSVSLQSESASRQIQKIQTQEYVRSLNANEQAEPSIFNVVRLKVASIHYENYGETSKAEESESKANSQEFITNINKKLKAVNLEVKIRFTDKQKWQYSFQFYDLKRNMPLNDINSLSAGQKAIIHLVFEAYGRGEIKGGLVIIDEPEIHLHYQFQNEYLQVINEINKEQKCQYILVTHSESLINSKTIHNVKRLTLNEDGFSIVKSPNLNVSHKVLVKILDNTRSTYAFFAKKVILVEGETDRYFINAVLNEKYPEQCQNISVLDITGKGQYHVWRDFFTAFGISVSFIGDLDSAFGMLYQSESPYKLTRETVPGFLCTHPDINVKIKSLRVDRIYILNKGDLEYYLDIHNKGIDSTIQFCATKLNEYLNDQTNMLAMEIVDILNTIINSK